MIPGMMNDDSKKLAVIIAKGGKETQGPEVEESKIGLKSACEEIISAVKGDNPEALMEALESAFDLIEASRSEGAESGGESGSDLKDE